MSYKGWTCEKHRKGREKLTDVLSDRKNVLPLQQHAYPASRKNSALRVSFLFLYTHDNEQDTLSQASHILYRPDKPAQTKRNGFRG